MRLVKHRTNEQRNLDITIKNPPLIMTKYKRLSSTYVYTTLYYTQLKINSGIIAFVGPYTDQRSLCYRRSFQCCTHDAFDHLTPKILWL